MNHAIFRSIGILEGHSFLVLLGVAMPLKYMWGMPLATKVTGMAHGMLFLAYLFAANRLARREGWSMKKLMMAYFATVIPFGPFLFEKKFLAAGNE